MRILKRLFTLWLMLSVLGLGTAWAFDSHAVLSGHDVVSGLVANDSHGAGDSTGCDHCCHLAFHLLGMPSDAIAPFPDGGHRNFAATNCALTSTPRDPPVRPPRS